MSVWRLSPLQWHPFTAIPAQQPSTLLSIIKRYGQWTEELMSRSVHLWPHPQDLIPA